MKLLKIIKKKVYNLRKKNLFIYFNKIQFKMNQNRLRIKKTMKEPKLEVNFFIEY